MSLSFNDLFNDFFNRKKKKDDDKLDNQINESAQKMLDILENIENKFDISEEIENKIDNDLGKPDSVERYIDKGMYFEKRIWRTENGELIKLLVSDRPFFDSLTPPIPEKPLQQQLDEALAIEDFEEAARLRDLINPKKKRTRKAK